MQRHVLRRLARCSALFLALVGSLALAGTDIADTPMAVKNNVAPNFMFMVDSSGSMRNIVPEAPYSPTATYLASCPNGNRQVPAGTSVDLRITGGVPKIYYGNNSYTLGSASNSQRCFDNNATYSARLLADQPCGGGTTCPTSLDAVYTGHYLNWFFGNYDGPLTGWVDRKKLSNASYAVHTRLEIAQIAAKATLDALPLPTSGSTQAKVRVGLSAYNSSDGGSLLRGIADLTTTNLAAMKTAIDGLDASGSTPLSETLADIGQYFTIPYTGNLTLHPNGTPSIASVASTFKQGTSSPHKLAGAPSTCSGTSCPVQYWCQRSYAILLTDGRPQNDIGLANNANLCDYAGVIGSCPTTGKNQYGQKTTTTHIGHLGGAHSYESGGSDYLDDVAQALYEIDLRPDLAAPAGRSKKNNVRTYTVGFADAQAKDDPLLQETAAEGGGLFLTADDTTTLTTAFKKAMDDALSKDGASSAVAVVNTQITVDNTAYASKYSSGDWSGDLEAFSLNTTTGLPITPSVWSAQAKLDARTAANRNIVTYSGTGGAVFSAASTGLAAPLVNYLRGDRSLEGSTYRRRGHLLGDIVNAEPVVVKYGDTPVIFQGANDGMLHVFNGSISASDTQQGQELWAYVPRLLLNKLSTLADPNYAHQFYVDATPAIADVPGASSTTKVLVGGLGKGGRGYYALDITSGTAASESAYAAKVLWEALGSDSRMGYSYGTPLIINTPSGWRVLVASGYNNGSDTSGDGHGRVFVLNPTTGAVTNVIDTGVGNAATPAGLTYLAKPNGALATDVISYVYGGDLLGNVWRFNLNDWSAVRIATLTDGAGNAQAITSAPVVGPVNASASKYFVYVGTGQYLGDSDVPGNTPQNAHATQTQSVYGIIDDTSVVSPPLPNIRGGNGSTCPSGGGTGAFVCQNPGTAQNNNTEYTNTTYGLSATQTGWYFDLPIANARVVTHPQLSSGGALVITVNVPTNTTCDPGGSSWFVNVDAANGGAIPTTYNGNTYWPSFSFQGYALSSRAVIVETADGKRAVIRFSDQTFKSPAVREPPKPPGAAPAVWRRIYWRELM